MARYPPEDEIAHASNHVRPVDARSHNLTGIVAIDQHGKEAIPHRPKACNKHLGGDSRTQSEEKPRKENQEPIRA
jgi:hypothetical protein